MFMDQICLLFSWLNFDWTDWILHSQVKVISHRREASVKRDIKVCDFCPIITPLDYIETDDVTQTNKFAMAAEEVGVKSNRIEKRTMVEKKNWKWYY